MEFNASSWFLSVKILLLPQLYPGISIYQVSNQGRSPFILWGNKFNLSKGNIITNFIEEAHASSKLIKKISNFVYIFLALKIYSILHTLAVTFFNLFSSRGSHHLSTLAINILLMTETKDDLILLEQSKLTFVGRGRGDIVGLPRPNVWEVLWAYVVRKKDNKWAISK